MANLRRNPNISITAVDEYKFIGYCLKGKARIVCKKDIDTRIISAWEKKITKRIAHRLLKNMREENAKRRNRHPESLLPNPEYMIAMEVSGIISLMPSYVR